MRIHAKGMATRGTVVTLFDVTQDLDVARFNFAKVRTDFLVTPLPLEFHDTSPPRDQMIHHVTLHGFRIHSGIFAAYRYSTEFFEETEQELWSGGIFRHRRKGMEAGGIEPPSESGPPKASTMRSSHFALVLKSPMSRIPQDQPQ